MLKFINAARSELEHVVWPTRTETTKYMKYNLAVIIVLTIFLMILGTATQSGLQAARGVINDGTNTTVTSDNTPATQAELDSLADTLQKRKDARNKEATVSAESASGVVATGMVSQ